MKDIFKIHIILIMLVALFSIMLFSNTVKNPFIWDDERLIVENAFIKNLKFIPVLFMPAYWNYYHPGGRGQYRPVRTVTFAIDYHLWKSNVFGYHLTNIALHSLNTVLVYLLALYLYIRKKKKFPIVPFLAALFFASHPVHVESVTWIKNRSDLLALFFFLTSFILFIKSFYENNIKIYIASIFSYILSLCSKEMGFALPLMLVLYILLLVTRDEMKRGLARTMPFFGVMGLYLIFKVTVLGMLISEQNISELALYQRPLLIIKTTGWYLRLLVLCFNLNAERLFPIPQSFFEPAVMLSLLGIAILALLMRILYRRAKFFSLFALSWIVITLLPATNIIFISGRPLAEQRLYIPSVGFCLLLAVAIQALLCLEKKGIVRSISKIVALLVIVMLTVAYSVKTFYRNLDWRDPIKFWSKTAEASPESSRVYYNLANQYLAAGRKEGAYKLYTKAMGLMSESERKRYQEENRDISYQQEEAIRLYEKALELDPATSKFYYNIGREYAASKDYQKAMEFYKKAADLEPDKADAYNNMGVVYTAQGEKKKAIKLYKKALSVNPNFFKAYVNLGLAYFESGGQDEAIDMYKKAIDINPYYAEAYNNLGVAYQTKGDIENALAAYDKAIYIKPKYKDIYYNKGVLYATNNMLDRSVFMFNKVIELDKYHVDAYYNLGLVYKRLDRNLLAIETLKKSIELMPRPDAYEVIGLAYMDINKIGEAIKAFKKALELDPEFIRAYGHLGQAYLRVGDMDSTIEYFKKAKEHGLKDPKIEMFLEGIRTIDEE